MSFLNIYIYLVYQIVPCFFCRLLEDLGHEMEHSQRRIDTLLSRTQKVLRLSNDNRQWCAILVLIVLLVIVISLFFI